MKSLKSKLGIIVAALLCVLLIGTCSLVQNVRDKVPELPQETILNQWKKEKQELQNKYEDQLAELQLANDSLGSVVAEKKKSLRIYQRKTSYLEAQLKTAIAIADSSRLGELHLTPLAENYFAVQNLSDSTCNETIHALEQVVANRDSAVFILRQKENGLREIQKEQELRNQYLTDQLNTAYKEQKRKIRQNKLLAAGLIFLSGFTTTLVIKQTLK
jgi:hypothetical protein